MGIDLQPRDYDVLGHVARYRMTRAKTIERRFFDPSNPKPGEGARTLIGRLVGAGFLQAAPLFAREKYYRLTTRGTALLGVPKKWAEPINNQQTFLRTLGLLMFCCHAPEERVRLSRDELRALFPELVPRTNSPINDYYREGDRLVRIKVDSGRQPTQLRDDCIRIVEKAKADPTLARLLANDRFGLAIVTARRQNARRLLIGLSNHPRFTPTWSEPGPLRDRPNLLDLEVPFLLEVVPDLVPLLANEQS